LLLIYFVAKRYEIARIERLVEVHRDEAALRSEVAHA